MKYRTCWLCGELKAHKAFAGLGKDECRRCLRPIETLKRKAREDAHRARANDPLYVLKMRMRSQLFGRTKAYERDIEAVLGYTMSQLMRHLERRFSPGMTWAEFNKGNIHIDHIVPISAIREAVTPGELFSRLWSLENLQPLWAKDNLTKKDRLPSDLPDWFVGRFGNVARPVTHQFNHRGDTQ